MFVRHIYFTFVVKKQQTNPYMKIPSTDLFEIIKSLSKVEKKMFTILNSRYSSTNKLYIELFNAIDKQQVYDEKKLLALFQKKHNYTNYKHLKNYLFNRILEFIENNNNTTSYKQLIYSYLKRTEVLYSKKLTSLAEKELKKAEKIALLNYDIDAQLEVLSWKRKLYVKQFIYTPIKNYENDIYKKEVELLNQKQQLTELHLININVSHLLVTQSENLSTKNQQELIYLVSNPLLSLENKLQSVSEKITRYRILGDIYFLLKDWEQHYYNFKQGLFFVKKMKLPFSEQLFFSSRLSISIQKLNKQKEMKLLKDEITITLNAIAIKNKPISLYSNNYIPFINNYIDYLLITDTEEALKTYDENLVLIDKYASKQGKLVFYVNASIAHFYSANFRKSLAIINTKILIFEKENVREDIVQLAMILSLLNHYELKNDDVFEYLHHSYSNYFNKLTQNNFAAFLLLDFFKTKNHFESKKETKGLIENLKNNLVAYQNDAMLKMFPFIAWLDSKIETRPFLEMLKQKAAKN